MDSPVLPSGESDRSADVAWSTSPDLGGVALVLAAAVAFGTMGPLAGLAYKTGVTPADLVVLRSSLGAALLAFWVYATGRAVRLQSVPSRQLVALAAAVVANGLLNLFYFAAFGQMTVALVLAVYFTYPVLVAIGSVALGRERFTPTRVAGLGFSVAGLLLVLGSQAGPDAALTAAGVACAAAAAACQATYLIVARAGFPAVPAEQVTGIVLTGCLAIAAPLALADGDASTLFAWVGDPRATVAVLLVGVLGAALGKVWALRGVRRIGGTRTAVLLLVDPLVGVVLAAVFLAQPITAPEVAGGALIIVGALLVQRPSAARPSAAPETAPAP